MFRRISRLWIFSWIKRSICRWSICLPAQPTTFFCTVGQELSASFKFRNQLFIWTLSCRDAVLSSCRPFIHLESLILHLSLTEPLFSSDANPFEVNCHHKKCFTAKCSFLKFLLVITQYMSPNVLHMQKKWINVSVGSYSFGFLLRRSMGIVQVKVRWLILTSGAGSSRPVLNQNPLGSLHYRGLFHVHWAEIQK